VDPLLHQHLLDLVDPLLHQHLLDQLVLGVQ
jgi:hypothetical protein